MAGRAIIICGLALAAVISCTESEKKPDPGRTQAPLIILKPKPKVMTAQQKAELGFPEEIIAQVEYASEAPAEPFFEEVMMRSSNLKGDVMIAGTRLVGFSVRTRKADQVIEGLSPSFRSQGFLIFRSGQNFGSVPDVVTVIRGNSSYDILVIQKTEAPRHQLDTRSIIAWLKEQQKFGSFVITGAGADWLEARFVRAPKNMDAFARNVAAFAPDVLAENNGVMERLADAMIQSNGFSLWWD
jgi:hypothetical protein